MLEKSVFRKVRSTWSGARGEFLIFMTVVMLIGASGCDRLRNLVCRQASSDILVSSPNGAIDDATASHTASSEIPLAPDKCLVDKHQNRIKPIVVAANATVRTSDGTVVRTPALLDRFYAFEIRGNELVIGTDPRGSAEGNIDSSNCVVTSQMQWLAFRQETRQLRDLVSGYSSVDDVRSKQEGKAVPAVCTETELSGGNTALRWMPVLNSHKIETKHGEIQVLEIGAWTIQRGTHASPEANVSMDNIKQSLRQVDVIVVLDCTGSMAPLWATMTAKLDEILNGILKSDLDARVAIVAFRDTDLKDEDAWVTKSTIFYDSVDPLRTWLSMQEPAHGGDWDEELFGGLQKALDLFATNGRPGAMKNIILIGDNGGHVKGQDTLLGNAGLAVVKTAEENGVTIDCIRVPYHAGFDGDKGLFPRQIEKLSTMTHGTIINLESTVNDSIVARLQQNLKQTQDEAHLQVQIATGLAEGKTKEEVATLNNIPPAAMEWRIDRIQQRLGSNPRNLSTPVGDVGVETIFVVTNPQAMEFGILMRKEEHEALLAVMDRLATSGIERPESLMELWNNSLSANTGDYDRPLNELLQLNGIPVRSGILSMTLSELMAMPHQARVALREQVELKFKRLAGATINLDQNGNLIVPVNAMP